MHAADGRLHNQLQEDAPAPNPLKRTFTEGSGASNEANSGRWLARHLECAERARGSKSAISPCLVDASARFENLEICAFELCGLELRSKFRDEAFSSWCTKPVTPRNVRHWLFILSMSVVERLNRR
jgi:hypothetical protein